MGKDTLQNEAINPFCRRCVRSCRQPAAVVLCDCPRFTPWPFRIHPTDGPQLDLFADPPARRR